MWQYIQTSLDSQLDKMMVTVYRKLNKKLDTLQEPKSATHNKETKKHKSHSRLINQTEVKYSREHKPMP